MGVAQMLNEHRDIQSMKTVQTDHILIIHLYHQKLLCFPEKETNYFYKKCEATYKDKQTICLLRQETINGTLSKEMVEAKLKRHQGFLMQFYPIYLGEIALDCCRKYLLINQQSLKSNQNYIQLKFWLMQKQIEQVNIARTFVEEFFQFCKEYLCSTNQYLQFPFDALYILCDPHERQYSFRLFDLAIYSQSMQESQISQQRIEQIKKKQFKNIVSEFMMIYTIWQPTKTPSYRFNANMQKLIEQTIEEWDLNKLKFKETSAITVSGTILQTIQSDKRKRIKGNSEPGVDITTIAQPCCQIF